MTGGEPLLQCRILKEFLPLIKEEAKIYLETNATLPKNLEIIKDYIDIISADIKLAIDLKSTENFSQNAGGVDTFAKNSFR